MAGWWTDAKCARWAKTFDEMPLFWKIVEASSYVLAPVCFAITAYYENTGWLRNGYWLMSGATLLSALDAVKNQRRGRAALCRGVQPASPKSVFTSKEGRLVFMWLSLLALTVVMAFIRPPHSFNSNSFGSLAWIPGIFFMQLSSYARSRFASAPEPGEPQAA